MTERQSGYYWVRVDGATHIGEYSKQDEIWYITGVQMPYWDDEISTVLFGPIPGPEELEAMAKDKARLDWLETLSAPSIFQSGNNQQWQIFNAGRRTVEVFLRSAIDAAIAQAAPEREKP